MTRNSGSQSLINQGVSIVLGTYNRKKFLQLTIDSVRKEIASLKFPCEIIVIDGGSTDGTLGWLLKQKDIITIIQHNHGAWQGKKIQRRSWGYFMNLGFKCAQYKYICMLSDDCLVVPGAIRNGYNLFEEELTKGSNTGGVAFYWRNWPDQELYWVGLTLDGKMTINHGMYLNKALQEVGYLDENFHFYFADGDLCLKIWSKGYKIIDSGNSYIEHYSHANIAVRNSNIQQQNEDWAHYLQKWQNIFYDPEQADTGNNIKKEFFDPDKTYRKFKSLHFLNIRHHIVYHAQKYFPRKLISVIKSIFNKTKKHVNIRK
ncbi:MAG: glycosyltransferase [Methanoregula sp.]|jgi:glycosyltransferase involved in cell wall biosynthesis|uniref:glycosyltransferase family 2 protein n=1 Tax=Methanoregula sp. TaxID=2052170 RepID=UPI003C17201B